MRALNAADTADRNPFGQTKRELAHHAKCNRFYRLRRIATGDCEAFYGRHGAQRVQVNTDYRQDCVDCGNSNGPTANGCERGLFDVGNVWSHFRPNRNPGNFSYPASDLFSQIRMFSHFGTHPALGHTVRAGKVELESVDTGVLDQFRQFLPTLFTVLLHYRSNQNVIGILLLNLAKLLKPHFDGPIRNQFDILESDDFTGRRRSQLAVSRYDIYDFGRFETHRFCDCSTPTGLVRFRDDASVCTRGARAQYEWIGEFHSVHGNREVHRLTP